MTIAAGLPPAVKSAATKLGGLAAKFDTTRTRAMLEPLALRPPPVRAYFRTLIEYAIATDWGKRAPAATVRVR